MKFLKYVEVVDGGDGWCAVVLKRQKKCFDNKFKLEFRQLLWGVVI